MLENPSGTNEILRTQNELHIFCFYCPIKLRLRPLNLRAHDTLLTCAARQNIADTCTSTISFKA